jgi:diguanylate cyclase (GGDEF)-like protein/PAS domain S-box-containing protein
MGETRSILIVDDDPSICKSLSAILRKNGYQTEAAHTGEAALTKARHRFFDLALLDIKLSDIGGIELIGQLKQQHPDMAVIMVTAHGSVDTAVQALNEGASAYIMKPFSIDEVLAAVGRSLEKQRLAAENRRLYEAAQHEVAKRRQAEKALSEQREYYRSFVESLTDWAWEMDAEGVHTYSNRAVEGLLGYTVDEVVGRHVTDLWPDEDRTHQSLDRLQRDLAARKGWRNVAARFKHRDGSVRIVESTAIPMLDAQGGLLGYRGIDRDITERRLAEEALRESEERYRELVQHQGEGIGLVDEDERFTLVNPAAEEVFGVRAGELVGRNLADFVEKDTWESIRGQTEMRRRGETTTYDLEIIRPDGERRQLVVTATPRYDDNGAFTGAFGVFRDITERKRAELALQASVRFLRIANQHVKMDPLLEDSVDELKRLTKCAAVGIRILDDDGGIPYQAYDGFSQDFYELESPLSIESDSCMCINVVKGEVDQSKPFYTDAGSFYMNGTTRFLATVPEEERGETRNACNRFGYESVALVPIRVADQLLGLIHVADPAEDKVPVWMVRILEQAGLQLGTAIQRVRAQEGLAHAASHDPLTGLANRQLVRQLFASERARARRSGKKLAVMYLDLDHFKNVNDTLGHTFGDSLLRAVADRLRGVPRTADTIARMGGDEFVLMVPDVGKPQDAVKVAERVMAAVRKPYDVGGVKTRITTSVGIALFPQDGDELDALLRAADIAMYHAKERGRDCLQVYEPDPNLEIEGLRPDIIPGSNQDPQTRIEPDS